MASLIYLDSSNAKGGEVLAALQKIQAGVGTLMALDGLRGQAIGDSVATMQTVFGVGDTTQAQALSDRWAALLASIENTGDADYAAFAKLRDLMDATIGTAS